MRRHRIGDRPRHRRPGREVHDRVGVRAARCRGPRGSRMVPSTSSTSRPRRFSLVAGRQVVEHDDVVAGCRPDARHEVRADEARSAGHDACSRIGCAGYRRPVARLFLSPPDVGDAERELLLDAFDSNWIAPLGPHVDAFEREFAESSAWPPRPRCRAAPPRCTSRSSCSASGPATRCSCRRSRSWRRPTRSRTSAPGRCSSTATRATWNLDPALVDEELDDRARTGTLPAAVIGVDLYGQCADYEPIVGVVRALRRPGDRGRGRGARRDVPGPARRLVRRARRVLVQRQQDHHHERRRHARLPTTRRSIERARYLATQARDPAPHYEHSRSASTTG